MTGWQRAVHRKSPRLPAPGSVIPWRAEPDNWWSEARRVQAQTLCSIGCAGKVGDNCRSADKDPNGTLLTRAAPLVAAAGWGPCLRPPSSSRELTSCVWTGLSGLHGWICWTVDVDSLKPSQLRARGLPCLLAPKFIWRSEFWKLIIRCYGRLGCVGCYLRDVGEGSCSLEPLKEMIFSGSD
ncbi:hypothetical protein SEVIR_1G265650v4 [Setaria viridis]